MKAIFRFIWSAIRAFNTLAALVFFILFLTLIISVSGMMGDKPSAEIAKGGALLFNPEGRIVEEKAAPSFDDVLRGEKPEEMALRTVLAGLDRAAKDDRIGLMVMDLERFNGAGPATLHSLGKALDAFRDSGKKIIAYGDSYTQSQYYLAAHADEIWLNPAGGMTITGYGSFQPYFAEALSKLKANVHVFRVGTFKSAVEPYIRDSMSDEAKEANRAFLDSLWQSYEADITRLRGLDDGALSGHLANIVEAQAAAGGDMAQMAVDLKWVDALKTRHAALAALQDLAGKKDDGYRHIGLKAYLKQTKPATSEQKEGPLLAVVTLRGTIIPGEAPVGDIGSESALKLIHEARTNDRVKALVLRVDSPGGSAFASELIRQAVLEVKAAGKPVVASFGSVAASGGYWISANADQIWAMPETITGSIGIFGLVATFEESLASLGVHSDGVGTTQLAGAFDITRPLSPAVAALVQGSIEDGYEKFLSIVAEGRGMSIEAVDKVAQGRVWAGSTARDLGLVDELGGLDAAIKAAASLASLEDGAYQIRHITEKPDPFEAFLMQLMAESDAAALLPRSLLASGNKGGLMQAVAGIEQSILRHLQSLGWMRDPKGAYSLCFACEVSGG
ncbi:MULTISPECIES: signal peptide peptidase SppA [unclassified Iodidimonas]|jgi:protease-4|uniref:signal peptide peptidase SppA n=1 Tax=unclassified Iodidimonas TaxID=2626145 RepID=UPI002482E969|nr:MULTISPECIES: signal peptide peptidase SppA [unclassified Iodidimonas]